MNSTELQEALDFALTLAAATGDLLMTRRTHAPVRTKRDGSLVTAADEEADRFIHAELHRRYPTHGIVSEETAQRAGHEAYQWVVDPLDGTTNFVLGLPTWGVLLCLLHEGHPLLTVQEYPQLRERYYATRGMGAFGQGERLHPTSDTVLDSHQFLVCCSRTWRHLDVRLPPKPRILGSAGYDLLLVARGVAAVGISMTPHLWDLAGGWLAIEEAGGRIQVLDGPFPFPVQPGTDYHDRTYPLVFAANAALLTQAMDGLRWRLTPAHEELAGRTTYKER